MQINKIKNYYMMIKYKNRIIKVFKLTSSCPWSAEITNK